MGLMMPSTFVAVTAYFSTRLGRAVGLSMAGTGIGQMVMPHVVRYLLDNYGFRGTTLIIGALSLNGVVGALLFQPVKWHMKSADTINETKHLLAKKDQGKINMEDMKPNNRSEKKISPQNSIESDPPKLKQRRPNAKLEELNSEKCKPTYWKRITRFMDLELLKDPIFLSLSMGVAVSYTASTNFSMLFPFFLQEGAPGLTRGQTAMCMSSLAGCDIISRLTLPSITYKLKMSSRTTYLLGSVALAAIRAAEQTDFVALMIVSGVSGYIRGATIVNQNLVLSDYCKDKKDKLPTVLGMNMCMKGVVNMSLGQLLGWIRDYTGSYSLCIHAQDVLLVMVAVMWLPEMVYKCCQAKKKTHLADAEGQER